MTTPLKARRRKMHSLRSPKAKKKPKPDLVKRKKFILKNIKKKLENKRPLKIVFFGSLYTRSEKTQKLFGEFLRKRGFSENFILSNVALNLAIGKETTYARIKLLKSADIIVADLQLIESAKKYFPSVSASVKEKYKVNIDEFHPSQKEFNSLLEKGISRAVRLPNI